MDISRPNVRSRYHVHVANTLSVESMVTWSEHVQSCSRSAALASFEVIDNQIMKGNDHINYHSNNFSLMTFSKILICYLFAMRWFIWSLLIANSSFLRYNHMDLVYTFLVWSPLNFHSSVVFLEYLDEYFPCMEDRLWKLQLFGRNRCESQKLFKMLKMEYKEPVQPDFPVCKVVKRRPDGKRKRRWNRPHCAGILPVPVFVHHANSEEYDFVLAFFQCKLFFHHIY